MPRKKNIGYCDLCNNKAQYGILSEGKWLRVCDMHERQLAHKSAGMAYKLYLAQVEVVVGNEW